MKKLLCLSIFFLSLSVNAQSPQTPDFRTRCENWLVTSMVKTSDFYTRVEFSAQQWVNRWVMSARSYNRYVLRMNDFEESIAKNPNRAVYFERVEAPSFSPEEQAEIELFIENQKQLPFTLRAHIVDAFSDLIEEVKRELKGYKEGFKELLNPPPFVPLPTITVLLYRDFKLFSVDKKLLSLKKGSTVTLNSDRLVTDVIVPVAE